MARRIEIFDTTLRDGNKLPLAVLSAADRLRLALQLERLGVDVIEAGFPSASREEAECVAGVAREVRGPYVAALARALDADVEKALESLRGAARPYVHVYMSVSPRFLTHVLRAGEEQALKKVGSCIRAARAAGARVQFSLSEAPHARRGFLLDAVSAAREAGAAVINVADTNGVLVPEDVAELVGAVKEHLGSAPGAPSVGVHCHDDLGLATANSMAAIRAGAGHVEVTVGGFGERAGNAPLEEVVLLISACGERWDICHGVDLSEIARTARLFESLVGIHSHPNKAIIGQCAFVPAEGGFPGSAADTKAGSLLQPRTIGKEREDVGEPAAPDGPYTLQAFNVTTGSNVPPVGLVVIEREGRTLTQTSHGDGPIDALFRAVDKALGFSTRMVLYSVSTLAAGTEARTEVTVTVELRGRRFHGRYTSTDVIEASLRAYMRACNAIGVSGILDGPSDFHVAGEYLWE